MSPIYFCLLVVIGSFFLLNLNLAVIMNEFTKVDDKFREEQEKLKVLNNVLLVNQDQDDEEEDNLEYEIQRSIANRDSDLKVSSFSNSQLRNPPHL